MAFVLIAVGLVLFVTVYQNTTAQLGSMLVADVFGEQGNKGYIYWVVAIAIVGAVGYIKSLKGLSDAFIGLLLLVLFISNKGFFAKFNTALASIGSGANTSASQSNVPQLGTTSTTPLTMPTLGVTGLGQGLGSIFGGMGELGSITGGIGSTTPGGWTVTS